MVKPVPQRRQYKPTWLWGIPELVGVATPCVGAADDLWL